MRTTIAAAAVTSMARARVPSLGCGIDSVSGRACQAESRPQRLLRVLERLVRGGDQHEKRGDRQQHAEEMSQPVGRGQMGSDTGQWCVDPGVDLRLRDEQDERKGQQRRPGE